MKQLSVSQGVPAGEISRFAGCEIVLHLRRKMMSPRSAADDVSPLRSEMMLLAALAMM
ncbi:MAG: hypothetical protein IJL71_00410 [Oscillospiraceae bacterium]|nr:hypothetical protein [Oscillospiraceae bacterium]